MTYDDLAKIIAVMDEEQRGNDVTVYDEEQDEFYMLNGIEYVQQGTSIPGDGILDEGHPFLTFVEML